MKLYIDKRISVAFWFAVIALAFLAWFSSSNYDEFVGSTSTIVKANSILFHSEEVKAIIIDIETGQRGFIITGDSSFLEPYFTAVQKIHQNMEDLRELLDRDDRNIERLEKISQLIEQKHNFAMNAIVARQRDFGASQQLVSAGEGKQIMDDLRTAIEEIQSEARGTFTEEQSRAQASMRQFNTTSVAVLLTLVVLFVTMFFLFNRSIAAQVRKEEKIKALNKELEAFSYSVSHDLRSPLRIIDGYVSILKEDYEDKLDGEGRKVIGVIEGNARRMGQLIDDLLDFAHMSRKQLIKTQLDFSEMVKRISLDYQTRYGLHNLELTVKPLETSYADLKMMEQVWVNLISNAVKYASKEVEPKIEIGSFRKNGDLCYYVKDNGVGFDMAYKDKLFGVFQRLHTVEEFPGTGVGLAIVKRIVSRHGGQVWADSKVNGGSTFYFSIPD